MMRIKKFFCFSESFIDLLSIKFLQKSTPDNSISMLAAPGSTIMHDTMKDFITKFFELNDVLCHPHIQHRFDVYDANAGMSIIIHFNSPAITNRNYISDKCIQVFERDGSIFNDGDSA